MITAESFAASLEFFVMLPGGNVVGCFCVGRYHLERSRCIVLLKGCFGKDVGGECYFVFINLAGL